MKNVLLLSFILTISNFTFAKSPKKEDTKSVMQDAFYSMTQLLPLLSSGVKFSDPKNEKTISSHISRMTLAFKKSGHQKMLKSPSFKPSVEALITNLEAAEISFNSDNKAFARMRLNDSTGLCISCHSQLPKDQIMSLLTNSKDLEKKLDNNQFELGNLYFILRNYDKAISHYMNYISEKSQKRTKKRPVATEFYNKFLYNAYFNIVYITAKAQKSPAKTIELLTKLSRKFNIPNYIQTDINIWKHRAKYWNTKYPKLNKKKFTNKEIAKIINNLESMMIIENSIILSSDYDYDLMLLSGILSNSILTNKKANVGTALYWLGLAEYRLGRSIFYNLGDQYLKQCIRKNSKKVIASKCYQALESEIIFRNTGTRGTQIPKRVKTELKKLKKLI